MNDYFIGATDVETEGTWLFADGSPATNIPWHSGDPSNSDGNEHWVRISVEYGTWFDQPASLEFGSVCKKG